MPFPFQSIFTLLFETLQPWPDGVTRKNPEHSSGLIHNFLRHLTQKQHFHAVSIIYDMKNNQTTSHKGGTDNVSHNESQGTSQETSTILDIEMTQE